MGMVFFMPVVGIAISATRGTLAGTFSGYGIDDQFVKELGSEMTSGSAASFVLVKKAATGTVRPAMRGFGGSVILTSFEDAGDRLLFALARSAHESRAGAGQGSW